MSYSHVERAQVLAEALPYIEIENTRIQRKLPDTLLIQVQECGDPLAWTQDGTVWLMSPAGKIVEQTDTAAGHPTVDGCELLAPSVGTQIAVDTAYETRRESLLELLAVLDETGDLAKVDPSGRGVLYFYGLYGPLYGENALSGGLFL